MQDYDNLKILEHVALATSIDQEWEGTKVNLMICMLLRFRICVVLPGWEEGFFLIKNLLKKKVIYIGGRKATCICWNYKSKRSLFIICDEKSLSQRLDGRFTI